MKKSSIPRQLLSGYTRLHDLDRNYSIPNTTLDLEQFTQDTKHDLKFGTVHPEYQTRS